MQEVEVQPVGPQPLQAGFARLFEAITTGIVRVYLADQDHLVAQSYQRLADEALGRAVAVYFSRVDDSHAKLDAGS